MVFLLIEYLRIVIASNYRVVSNSHTLQFATACTKSSQTVVPSQMCYISVLTFTANFLLYLLAISSEL
jgi:hypothetical protein